MNRPTRLLGATLALHAAALVGCTDLTLDGDEQLTCGSNADCPAPFVCSPQLQRCIAEEVAAEPPIELVGEAVIDASRISRVEGFARAVVTVTFSKPPVSTTALADNRLAMTCEADEVGPAVQRCGFDARDFPAEADGGYDLIVVGVDGAGNEARARARVELDTTPPALAPGSVALVYELRGEGLVRDVSALGPQTRAILQFSLTEEPAAAPVVEILAAGAPLVALTRDAARSAGPLQVYVIDGDDAALSPEANPDGSHAVRVALSDDVGNAAALDPAVLVVVDTTAPAAPTTDVDDAIVHHRVPWGTRSAPGAQFSVSGAAGVAEPDGTVLVTSDASLTSSQLGQGVIDGTGGFDVDLQLVDVPRVFVRVIDGAGNVGPPARVRDVVWTASMGGGVRGDAFSNPHQLFNVTAFDSIALAPNLVSEAARPGDLVDGDDFVIDALPRRTEQLTVASGQPRRMAGAMGYLPTQKAPVIFGGVAVRNGVQLNETFVRRGGRWIGIVENPPFTGPLAFDAAQDELVSLITDGNLWGFDGATWRQRPTPPIPTIERGPIAYDPLEGRLVTVQATETWVLDDGTSTWRQIANAPFRGMATYNGLQATAGGVLAFEGVTGRVIFYGPEATGTGAIFALVDEAWVRVADVPPFRTMTAIEDPRTGAVHFHCREGSGDRGSLLTWNGTGLATGPADIDPLTACQGVVDLAENTILIHGGTFDAAPNQQAFPSDQIALLEEGSSAWRPLLATAPFLMRHNNGGTSHFNPVLNRVIFHGGTGGGVNLRNVTLWDGRTGVGTTNTLSEFLSPFFDGAVSRGVEDASHAVLINGTWTTQSPAPFIGPAGALFTYDEVADTAIGFGGTRQAAGPSQETYRIRGNTFTAFSTTTRPPSRTAGAIVWDAANGRAVMAAGQSTSANVPFNDVWAFENGDWRQLPDLPLGATGRGIQLAYDRARGVVVGLFRGRLFELRDDAWVERIVDALPRADALVIYDEINQDLMFLGGLDLDFIPTTANRIAVGPTRAGQVAAFNLAQTGARTDAVVLDVGLGVTAGATGADADGAVDGVDVLVWGRHGFVPVGSIEAPASAPASLSTTMSPDTLEGAVGRDRLFVALRSAPTGPALSPARLVGRQLELTLRYREP